MTTLSGAGTWGGGDGRLYDNLCTMRWDDERFRVRNGGRLERAEKDVQVPLDRTPEPTSLASKRKQPA